LGIIYVILKRAPPRSFYRKVSIEKLILAPIALKVIGVSSLVYIGLVGLKGFYKEVFR